MNKYYRVVEEFLGKEYTFIPKNTYEYIDFKDGILTFLEGKSPIKEVCFSKKIPNCFFAIAPFLILDKTYYIYETDIESSVDLSRIKEGDFEATKEVRYRKPVYSKYIGKFKAHESFHESITDLYRGCCMGENGNYFYNSHAIYVLSSRYDLMYEEIEFLNDEIRNIFPSPEIILNCCKVDTLEDSIIDNFDFEAFNKRIEDKGILF